MIAPRELATQLAGSIFDHIERERTLVRHSIEDVLHDGLLLGLAKQASGPQPPQTGIGAANQELRDAVIKLVKLIMREPELCRKSPAPIVVHLQSLYAALIGTGWHP